MRLIDNWLEKLRDGIAASTPAQKLWAYYETAAPREQFALRALGIFLTVVLVAVLIVLPLHRFNANAIAEYRAQNETLQWMQDNRGAIGTNVRKNREAGATLLSLANQEAHNFNIAFKRYEPNANQGLNLWLEQVPFNQMVRWLDALERDYGIVAVELAVSHRNEAGMVDARIVLKD